MSIKSERFKEMRAIRDELLEKELFLLEAQLHQYKLFNDNELGKYVLGYFRKKLAKAPPIRPYLIRKFIDYLNFYQEGTHFHYSPEVLEKLKTKLSLVFEATVCVQYLHNHILDEKYEFDLKNCPKLWKNMLASNLLKGAMFAYLNDEVRPLLYSPEQFIHLQELLNKLFLVVDAGQRLDKHFSNYRAYRKADYAPFVEANWLEDDFCRNLLSPFITHIANALDEEPVFLRLYFHRIYQTNVFFFRTLAKTAITFFPGLEQKHYVNLEAFAILYGYMLQIINDYADFAYTEDEGESEKLETGAKKSTDVFADLYNFNITLPLLLHLQHDHRRKVELYLNGGQRKRDLISEYPREVMRELMETGSIQYCIYLAQKIAAAADRQLDKNNPTSLLLMNATDMARDNKYYKIFK